METNCTCHSLKLEQACAATQILPETAGRFSETFDTVIDIIIRIYYRILLGIVMRIPRSGDVRGGAVSAFLVNIHLWLIGEIKLFVNQFNAE